MKTSRRLFKRAGHLFKEADTCLNMRTPVFVSWQLNRDRPVQISHGKSGL